MEEWKANLYSYCKPVDNNVHVYLYSCLWFCKFPFPNSHSILLKVVPSLFEGLLHPACGYVHLLFLQVLVSLSHVHGQCPYKL